MSYLKINLGLCDPNRPIFLSHLLVAVWDIGVELSVHSSIRLSTIHFEVLFSAAVIAASMKPCIHHDPVPLTYISRSTDFLKILGRV